jgi:predicted PurR-regulated permease PerM
MKEPTEAQCMLYWKTLGAFCLLVWVLLIAAFIYALAWTANLLSNVLLPLAFAAILAYILHPLVTWVEKRGLPRAQAVLLVMVVIALAVGGLLLWIVPQLYGELADLKNDFPQKMEQLRAQADAYLANHPDLYQQANELQLKLQKEWPAYSSKAASYAGLAVSKMLTAIGFLLGLVFVPLYVFYLLVEQENIHRNWRQYFPLKRSKLRDEVLYILEEVNKHLVTFFRGQVLVAGIIGVLTGTGLLIAGLSYAALIGVVAGTLSIIPYLGVVSSLVPALLVAYAQSNGSWGYVAAIGGVFALVQLLEGLVISPKIMGDKTGLHPMTIILAIMVWSILLGGLLGAILAVPLTATLKVLMNRYVWQNGEAPAA